MNRPKTMRHVLIQAVAIATVAAISSVASAQFRIDNSSARDANNRLGSGGFNTGGIQGNAGFGNNGLAGNFIVTGNTTGGRAFRGTLGYTDPNAFRGSIAGGATDVFIRSSAGFNAQGQFTNNAGGVRPFFGRQNVGTPEGFQRLSDGSVRSTVVRSAALSDTRMDFGGLSRQQIASSPARINLVRPSDSTGVSGLINPPLGASMSASSTVASPRSLLPASLSEVDVLSEYTALTRRADLTAVKNVGSASDVNSTSVLPNARLDPNQVGKTPGSDTSTDPSRLTNVGLGTGQGSQLRDLTAGPRSNAQLNELQRRLDEVRQRQALPGDESARNNREINNEIVRKRQAEAERQREKDRNPPVTPKTPGDRGETKTPTVTPPTVTPTPGATTPTVTPAPGSSTPASVAPASVAPASVAPASVAPASVAPASVAPAAPTGNPALNLPTLPTTPTTPTTPSATPPAPADTASPAATILPVVPLEIRSIAEGTTGNVRELIARAEELMREGKFNSAIDQFDNADRISPDDPLIFMGRSIAELGASYYRRSEVHLRQAFERSPELLLARYDLKAMVGESRLEFLVGELKQLASSNATDPGPLMLLAFIHFSVDDAPRAKTLLEEAQRRAPNDRAVKIMQATWQTVNTPASNTPANDNK